MTEAGFATDLIESASFSRYRGHEVTKQWLLLPPDERPTAIFAANDLSAHGAVDALHEAGLRVPEDVSIVGYDDTWYSTLVRPALTSVRMGVLEMGRTAADMLISRLEGASNEHAVLPVSLTIRESTATAALRP